MSLADDDHSGPISVLYVNGDADFADLARTKLLSAGSEFALTTAGTADEALEHIETSPIDCVVTCYSLPGETGIDFLQRLRSDRPELPTILFTGRGSEQIASDATRADVSDYIPIRSEQNNFELLARRIQTLVKAARKTETAERMTTRFRRTLERTTDAIYAVDDEWRVEYLNEQMADRVGRDPDSVIGVNLWEEFPSIAGTELEARYRTAMETGEPDSSEQRLGDPFDYWVEIRVFPDDDGMTVFSREITAERERERELERSETILENIHDVVFVLGEHGTIEFANAAAKRVILDHASEPVTGQRLETAVGDRITDSDGARFVQAVETALDEIQGDGRPTGLYDVDLQLDVTADNTERTLDARITPFESGPDQQVLVVARDVTERTETSREVELKRQNDRLDEFASVVAHDLRNPLSVAIGFLDVVEQTGELDHVDRIASAHDRMERLIDDLLTLARGETKLTETEQVDLEMVTTKAWGFVDTAGATLTVAEDVPAVASDGGRLTQLFENLFRNAIEHGGETVSVTVGSLADEPGFYVEDDGDGIPPDRRDHVLEHGVTSNEDGTGFGLSIVSDIATAHNWTVRVTAGTDGGARFEFVGAT